MEDIVKTNVRCMDFGYTLYIYVDIPVSFLLFLSFFFSLFLQKTSVLNAFVHLSFCDHDHYSNVFKALFTTLFTTVQWSLHPATNLMSYCFVLYRRPSRDCFCAGWVGGWIKDDVEKEESLIGERKREGERERG
jgi:hypothetical protein